MKRWAIPRSHGAWLIGGFFFLSLSLSLASHGEGGVGDLAPGSTVGPTCARTWASWTAPPSPECCSERWGHGTEHMCISFGLQSRSRIRAELTGVGGDAQLTLLDAEGNTIARSADPESVEALKATLDPGTYCVRIR